MADLSTSHASANRGAGGSNSGGQSRKAGFLRSRKFLGGGGDDIAVAERTALVTGAGGVVGGGHDDDDGGGGVWFNCEKGVRLHAPIKILSPPGIGAKILAHILKPSILLQ